MKRPNFLFIFVDQLRSDALGSLGLHPPLRTPVLDDLAANGVRFANCSTPNPLCVPARESILTGRWGHRFGCISLNDQRAGPGVPTFPAILQEAGYVTFAVGKQHFNPVRDHHGYGRLLLSEDRTSYRQDDDYLLYLRDHGFGHLEEPWGRRGSSYYVPQPSPLPPELHVSAWTARRCAELIRANRNRSFLATAAFLKPHPPLDPPWMYLSRYDPASVRLPPSVADSWTSEDDMLRVQNHYKHMDCPDDSRIRDIRASYYALITQIDEEIAILIDTLKDCGIYDNTVIIFTADHGELLGDHKAWGKRSFYEGSVAVPLIVHWPDELPSGVVRELPVSVLDLFPTILTMAGVIPGSSIDGVDLLPLARDGIIPDERAGGVASEHGKGRELKLMWRWQEISGREVRQWKYVWLCNGGMEQLFDLTKDPDEAHNRAAQDRDRCRKAHEQLVRWCEVSGFSTAVTNDRQLMNLPFELLPLRGVNDQRSEWVNNDPDWNADC